MSKTTTATSAPSIDRVAYAQRIVRKLVTSKTCDRSRGAANDDALCPQGGNGVGWWVAEPDFGSRRQQGAKRNTVDDDEDRTIAKPWEPSR